ncbi:MAG: DUF885 family protein [Cyclobacteriaceae bacterium]
MNKHLTLLWPISLALFLACTSETNEKEELSTELNEWLDVQYEEWLQQNPLELTAEGRKDLYDQIDDMSEEALGQKLAWLEGSVKEMQEKFPKDQLNPEVRVSFDLWQYQYDMAKGEADFRNHYYIFHQMGGNHTGLPNTLINYHKVDEPADMEALISRIRETGRAIRQLLERAKKQSKEGIRPPRFAYEMVIPQAEALIKGKPFDTQEEGSPLWTDANTKIDSLKTAGKIDEEQAIQYFTDNSSISQGAIKAEVRRYMVMPGQATGYKIGMLQIQELRALAEEELGDQFDLRSFHNTVLSGGALPLDILEEEVKRWIVGVKEDGTLYIPLHHQRGSYIKPTDFFFVNSAVSMC